MNYSSVESLVDDPASSLSIPVSTESESSPTAIVDLEARLGAFVQWVLKKSCSGKYPPAVSLKMMDKAWRAQKMLWRLRQQQVLVTVNNHREMAGDRNA